MAFQTSQSARKGRPTRQSGGVKSDPFSHRGGQILAFFQGEVRNDLLRAWRHFANPGGDRQFLGNARLWHTLPSDGQSFWLACAAYSVHDDVHCNSQACLLVSSKNGFQTASSSRKRQQRQRLLTSVGPAERVLWPSHVRPNGCILDSACRQKPAGKSRSSPQIDQNGSLGSSWQACWPCCTAFSWSPTLPYVTARARWASVKLASLPMISRYFAIASWYFPSSFSFSASSYRACGVGHSESSPFDLEQIAETIVQTPPRSAPPRDAKYGGLTQATRKEHGRVSGSGYVRQ